MTALSVPLAGSSLFLPGGQPNGSMQDEAGVTTVCLPVTEGEPVEDEFAQPEPEDARKLKLNPLNPLKASFLSLLYFVS
jgi:hypothetical protein